MDIIDEQTRYMDNPRAAFFCRYAEEYDCPECGGRLDTDGEGVWCTTSDCDGPEDE